MKKRIITALSLLIALCVLTMTVYAIEVPDLDRTGSISFDMTYQGAAVPGGSLTLYRVAEVHVENDADYSFRYVEAYAECGVSLDALDTAETAKGLADYTAAKAIEGVTVPIDEAGHVAFTELELGLYLLVQAEAAPGYSAANPFLVSVPGREGSAYVYDVNAAPKLDLEPEETTPPTTEPTTAPTVPTEPNLPQTGQNHWPVPVLAVSGLFLVAFGWCLRRGAKEKGHEG